MLTCTLDASTVTCWLASPTCELNIHIPSLVGQQHNILHISLESLGASRKPCKWPEAIDETLNWPLLLVRDRCE